LFAKSPFGRKNRPSLALSRNRIAGSLQVTWNYDPAPAARPPRQSNRMRPLTSVFGTICLGLRRPRDFNRVTSATIAGLYRMADRAACIVQREEPRCQSWRYVSLDRQTFPTDAAAGSIPIGDHLAARAQYIRTRQFGQHDASQSFTNANGKRSRVRRRSNPTPSPMKDGSPLGIGGLWETWKDPTSGEWVRNGRQRAGRRDSRPHAANPRSHRLHSMAERRA